jgi:menaquinone-9 beta-reductase
LIEREASAKDKVCGEFLSREALLLLERLRVPLPKQAKAIHTVRLAAADHLIEAPLPFAAQSLSRRYLDALLLRAAEGAGVTVLRGLTAESLTQTSSGWQATVNSHEQFAAPQVVLATGKHDLRGFPRPRGQQNDLVAFKMYWRLVPNQSSALQHTVELHLHRDGYSGLQPVEDGAANLTVLVHRQRLARLGGWAGLLGELKERSPVLAERLHGAEPLLEKPLALSSIPYGFVRKKALADGLFAVGDQAAVIPSFTGDGMSVALFTGWRAAQAILDGQSAQMFQRAVHRQLCAQVARATLLSRALVHPRFKAGLLPVARLWPGVLRCAAAMTRLSEPALQEM